MMHFCTLFDANYLTRALAMHRSLEKVSDDFHLYFFTMDKESENVLRELKLNSSTIVPIADIENEKLLNAKINRTSAEYCWTCTPSIINYSLQIFNLNQVTYLDADLFFYSNPKILLDEMRDNSVLITEHRYSPQSKEPEIFGKYCVQFISFKNDFHGNKILQWWKNECIKWCYNRIEDGKFGDQKYLDNWTTEFEKIYVLQNFGGLIAPWNLQQFNIYEVENELYIKHFETNKTEKVVYFHFHFLKFYENNLIDIGDYHINENAKSLLYEKYINELEKYREIVSRYSKKAEKQAAVKYKNDIDSRFNRLKRKIKMTLNIYPFDNFGISKINE